nr:uncharacterized protein C8orf74 homolog [Lytechinus pictus]
MAETITVENAKCVANLGKMDGRLQLGEFLGWTMADFDEDAQMRESILLDFLYESLMFGAQKGVPWSQIPALVQVASEFQKRTIVLRFVLKMCSEMLKTEDQYATGMFCCIQEAKPLNIWEYERKMSEIEEEEKSRLNQIKLEEETILNDIDEKQPFKDTKDTVLDRQQVSELINDAIQHHTTDRSF